MAWVHSRDCFKHFVDGHHGIKEFTKCRDLIEMDEHEQTTILTESSNVLKRYIAMYNDLNKQHVVHISSLVRDTTSKELTRVSFYVLLQGWI